MLSCISDEGDVKTSDYKKTSTSGSSSEGTSGPHTTPLNGPQTPDLNWSSPDQYSLLQKYYHLALSPSIWKN